MSIVLVLSCAYARAYLFEEGWSDEM